MTSSFARVVCGIDGSEEALEAARQAARLAGESLVLVAAVDPWDLVLAPPAEAMAGAERPTAAELRAAAVEALERSLAEIEPRPGCTLELRLEEGRPLDTLVAEAMRVGATLVVAGPSGRGRLAGIALGSVAAGLAHHAPCAVLIARPTASERAFPSSVVVGVDGSAGSESACVTARELRDRFGADVRFIAGTDGADIGLARAAAAPDALTAVPGGAVGALLDGAAEADLLVVGCRGLHGIRALGSVSEEVVHAAPCSVLVLRDGSSERAEGPAGAGVAGETEAIARAR